MELLDKEKIKKRLIKRSEKNKVPYYHELAKFNLRINKDYERLRKKHEKLKEEDRIYKILIEEYRKTNDSH